jgi:hypothetical protein
VNSSFSYLFQGNLQRRNILNSELHLTFVPGKTDFIRVSNTYIFTLHSIRVAQDTKFLRFLFVYFTEFFRLGKREHLELVTATVSCKVCFENLRECRGFIGQLPDSSLAPTS